MISRFKFAFLGIFILGATASATEFTFTPSGSRDLWDLPHGQYYVWGLNWTKPADEEVVGITIKYKEIYDWTREEDRLSTFLIDTVTMSSGVNNRVYQYNDSEYGPDNFKNYTRALIGTWNDPYGDRYHKINLPFSVTESSGPYDGHYAGQGPKTLSTSFSGEDLLGWVADGNFGFGIDPDCHYYNCGVEVVITTCKPEDTPQTPDGGASVLLLGSALMGVAFLRRKIR